ncbi:MAG: hypothetical protein QG552_1661 [Thermodesulfobacteriota bacterium]|nr:hypothetical protein [Thermodesulfobacteriota bacterium]
MKRKGKPKKRPASLPPLGAKEEDLVAQLIQEMGSSAPADILKRVPDPFSAQRLIELLPSEESVVPLLLALKHAFQDKNVGKAVKRAVFRLNRKGVSTEAFFAEEEGPLPILKPVRKDPPLCYIGPVNGAGIRTVVLILHRGGKGLDTGFGVVSDEEGMLQFVYHNVSRKDAKRLTDGFSEDARPFVETSLAHVATILEGAYQMQVRLRSDAPVDYLELRPWLLENAPLLERPMIYDLIPEAAKDQVLSDAAIRDLFDDPLLESWLIEPDAIRPFMKDMYSVNESPIVLTTVQKAARVRAIQEKCMAEIFTAEKRERLKRRLEEMGYLFFKLGQEKTAETSLAAALAAVQEPTVVKANPVIEALLAKSLASYRRAIEERGPDHVLKRGDASPIILP